MLSMLSYHFASEIPAAPPKSPEEAITPAPRYPTLAGKRVVIVEDEGLTQMQLRRILKNAGMHVAASAVNGPEGVEAARRESPDLVLMDITMPGGFDGLEAARRILAERRLCLVMLTAYTEYQEEAMRLGARGYIVKPILTETLLPSLETTLRSFYDESRSSA